MANNADIKFNVDNLELFYGNFKALKGIDMEMNCTPKVGQKTTFGGAVFL